MFATRIFIYEIQRWQLKPGIVSKIVSGEPLMVNLSKGLYQGYLRNRDGDYRRSAHCLNQTAKPGERFDRHKVRHSTQALLAIYATKGLILKRASNRDASSVSPS